MDPSNAQAEVALGAAMQGDLAAGIAHTHHGIKLSSRDRRLAFWGWVTGSLVLRNRLVSRPDAIRAFIYRRFLKPWHKQRWGRPNSNPLMDGAALGFC
jgi:hypothetical protein